MYLPNMSVVCLRRTYFIDEYEINRYAIRTLAASRKSTSMCVKLKKNPNHSNFVLFKHD